MTTTVKQPEPHADPPSAAPAAPPAAPPADDRDRFFRTDHLMADLKGRTVRGGAVTMAAQGVKFILQMGSTMILARLLTPADFGLVAMVTAITGFVAMFKDAGLSMATVQRENITHGQVSTLFWINVGLSVVLMAGTAALAPAIAWFYAEPRLLWITLAIAGTFLFSGLTIQHQALLRRQMEFKKLAIIQVAAQAAGIAVAATIAFAARSYWALVAMGATMALVTALLTWLLSGWAPGRPARGTGVRPMLKFGGNLTGFTAINYWTRNSDNLMIGAFLGAGPLGLYSKAYNLLMMPIRQFNGPISGAVVPALSRLQNEPDEYRRLMLKTIRVLAFVGMPLIAFLFADAQELTLLILGSKWSKAADLFRILAPAAFIGTLNVVPGWLCCSLGWPQRQVHWALISAPVTVASFAIGLQWGAAGVAAGFSISWTLLLIVFIAYSAWESPVGVFDIVRAIGRQALAALAACGAAMALGALQSDTWPLAARLAADTLAFAAIYFIALAVMPNGQDWLYETLTMARHIRRKRA